MTIGVGFKCSDGIVLCADNQITWLGSHKNYECKLYPHRQHEWSTVFTFAGNPNLMKSFNDKFDETMKMMKAPFMVSGIRDVIETVLSFFDVLKDNPTDLCLLCAICVSAEKDFRLFKTEGYTIHEVAGYDYVGIGDSSLLRYLGQLLTSPSEQRPYGYIVRQGAILGSYLVLKAKTHIDGCGGDTDTWILRPSGQLEVKSGGEVYRTEQTMLKLEMLVKKVASCFFDKRVTDEELATTLDFLIAVVKDEHFEFRIPAN